MRDCCESNSAQAKYTHYFLRIRDTPRSERFQIRKPDWLCAVDQTWQFLLSARAQFPPLHSLSIIRGITLVCARTQLRWCRRRRCCHTQKSGIIHFLKAPGFSLPSSRIFIFFIFYKCCDWLRALYKNDTKRNVFDIIHCECEALTLHSPERFNGQQFLLSRGVFFPSVWRGGYCWRAGGGGDSQEKWMSRLCDLSRFHRDPCWWWAAAEPFVGVSHVREDSLSWIF